MTPLFAVVVFPGSNCEHDVAEALGIVGADARLVWHSETQLGPVDGVVLPGGFAHGDYLRPGAIARFSPIMSAVTSFAADGGKVVGICNGFQVLTEAGLLPGALRRNAGLRFVCKTTRCRVASTASVLTCLCDEDDVLELPINHNEGNYTCDATTLRSLEEHGQVILRYEENPNGSLDDIAGICNREGNVVGLMPHPERACREELGSCDGRLLLGSLVSSKWTPTGPSPTAPYAATR